MSSPYTPNQAMRYQMLIIAVVWISSSIVFARSLAFAAPQVAKQSSPVAGSSQSDPSTPAVARDKDGKRSSSSIESTEQKKEVAVLSDFFERKVRPLLISHCYECHSGSEKSGGLMLDTAEATHEGGDSGPAVVPGDLDASLLIKAIRYSDPDFAMPPSGKLSASEIEVLEKWVTDGAFDPRTAGSTSKVSEGAGPGMSIADGRSFWSMQQVLEPEVPTDSNPWVRSSIDAFILDGLTKKDLQPAKMADRETLIRRLKYDLLGLPPTSDEILDFVNDPSPLAYRRLVDRYLSSEQYGVRWGRHWLDVARYADSNGLDENLAFGTAWKYRDYVVSAFNKDKPFDDFVTEQLAGDLVPDANRETITATGFLVLGAKVLAEPDREKLEMDTIDEQLDTMGKAFLGMTFGCVRCHDHKFDPITQADYYSLAALFKSTKTFGDTNTGAIKHWNEHVFATEQDQESIKVVDEKIAALKKQATDYRNQAFAALRQQSRKQATDYLVAATAVDVEMSLEEIKEIAAPAGLHPRVLHHCRKHLNFNAEDPVFAVWHQLSGDDHAAKVEAFYRTRFEEAAAYDPKAKEKKEGESDAVTEEVSMQMYHAALMDQSGFLALPPRPDNAFDEETYLEYCRLMEVARLYESSAPDVDSVMGVQDGEIVSELAIHIRGNHRNLGAAVKRHVPEVMRAADESMHISDGQSGRLELARWMTSGRHPLTARVQVNRIWRWHFGSGLVETTENFGSLGSRPTHPKLLDWLAFHYEKNGWSTKWLQRMIVLSSTYRQASQNGLSEIANRTDPENKLLWKFPMMRLEAEQLHDSILAISGQLDPVLGGKTVPLRNRQFVFNHTSVDHTKYDSVRRAIYLPVIRNNLYTTFEQFDFPDPTMPTGSRSVTIVAPQALLLMNSPMVIAASNDLAERLLQLPLSKDSRVEEVFLQVLGRTPSQWELKESILLLRQVEEGSGSIAIAWSTLCQSLFAANEFMYIR